MTSDPAMHQGISMYAKNVRIHQLNNSSAVKWQSSVEINKNICNFIRRILFGACSSSFLPKTSRSIRIPNILRTTFAASRFSDDCHQQQQQQHRGSTHRLLCRWSLSTALRRCVTTNDIQHLQAVKQRSVAAVKGPLHV
jgi:hypothetical protein